jgi:hypothetical protein
MINENNYQKISRALNQQARGKAVISLSAGGLFMNEKSFGRLIGARLH